MNNMNIIPNMNNMNMMPIMNNMNMIPNMNNMNMIPFMNNMNMMPIMNNMDMMPNMIDDEKQKKEQEKINNINDYYNSKKYEIDFKRIEYQNKIFQEIKKKLMYFINNLEKLMEVNKKILDTYLEKPYIDINYTNLITLSCSIEDQYEDILQKILTCFNEIKNIIKLGIKDLKNNYLNDFNKKYNAYIKDEYYVGFRNTGLLKLYKLDEVKFKELCRINFHNLKELELKYEDNINIEVLTKATYKDISFLGLLGKISDINILSNLPFKNLTTLFLSNNDFSQSNIDIFRNVPFLNLKKLLLSGNKIINIEGLYKSKFFELIELNLDNNLIRDINPLKKFQFLKLERFSLCGNKISNINILSEVKFTNLQLLRLDNNQIRDIDVLSKVPFINLDTLILKENQIEDISVFSYAPFIHLTHLDLRNNQINNISVFSIVPFINLQRLLISHNKINDFRVFSSVPFKQYLTIFVDNRQLIFINQIKGLNNLKFCLD